MRLVKTLTRDAKTSAEEEQELNVARKQKMSLCLDSIAVSLLSGEVIQ